MRGRLASFAIGGAIARRRTQSAMQGQAEMQNQQYQMQQQQMEIERLKNQQAQSAQQAQYQPQYQPQQNSNDQVDVTQQLQKFAELHQKGALTDSEFQQLKMKLLSQM
jgi:hypothetical protein